MQLPFIYMLMKHNIDPWEKAFEVHVPENLHAKIFSRIALAKRRSARMHFAATGALAFASGIALIPSFQYVAAEFSTSGFSAYLSLLFSDGAALFGFWHELVYSLAESLPVIGMVLFLSVLFVWLASLRFAARDMHRAFPSVSFKFTI